MCKICQVQKKISIINFINKQGLCDCAVRKFDFNLQSLSMNILFEECTIKLKEQGFNNLNFR
jgi:hypothetical protein